MSAVIVLMWGIVLENNGYFYKLSFLIIGVFIFLTAFVFLTAKFFSLQTYRIILYAAALLLLFAAMLLLAGFIWINRLLSPNGKDNRITVKNPLLAKLSCHYCSPRETCSTGTKTKYGAYISIPVMNI